MAFSTKLASVVLGGMLAAAAFTPAWAGASSDTTTTAASQAAPSDHSLVGVLSPFLADAAPHQAQKNCKADSLYSNHDVVGDSDACFVNKFDVRTGVTTSGAGSML